MREGTAISWMIFRRSNAALCLSARVFSLCFFSLMTERHFRGVCEHRKFKEVTVRKRAKENAIGTRAREISDSFFVFFRLYFFCFFASPPPPPPPPPSFLFPPPLFILLFFTHLFPEGLSAECGAAFPLPLLLSAFSRCRASIDALSDDGGEGADLSPSPPPPPSPLLPPHPFLSVAPRAALCLSSALADGRHSLNASLTSPSHFFKSLSGFFSLSARERRRKTDESKGERR